MRTIHFALFWAILSLAPKAFGVDASVDLGALQTAGEQTAMKLLTAAAQWDGITTLRDGSQLRVSILHANQKQRIVITAALGSQSMQLARIIQRDGVWFVSNAQGDGKYRPNEAPMGTPAYLAMLRADLHFVHAANFQSVGTDSADANTITLRQPVDPAMARQMQAVLDQMAKMVQQAGKMLTADQQAQFDAMRDMIDHGMPTTVDRATGMVMAYGASAMRTIIEHFQFLDKVSDDEFSVDDRQWQDFSDDPTAGNLDDLLMIAHDARTKPGDKNYDPDGCLMDVSSGRFRRLPMPGMAVMPGCFLKDRKNVIVTGVTEDSTSLRPFRIDLKTQKYTQLGKPFTDSGQTMFADVSPDGSTAAMVHMDATIGLLNFQILLVDVATGTAKPLGKPMDTAFLNWTADGQHLVLVTRQSKDLNAPPLTKVAIMDMDGNITELRNGDQPTLLADRKTILYRDDDAKQWHTCDLSGQNDQLFGDGLSKDSFPAPAPDGKRMIIMHFEPGKLPVPELFNVGDSQGKPITQVGGLWAEPVWR